METRLYFILGDVLATTGTGAVAGTIVASFLPTGWGMVVGMAAGMVVGMVVGFVLAFALVPLFGALEIMAPTMLAGMVGGMATGMVGHTAASLPPSLVGAGCGLVVFAYTYAMSARMAARAE